MLLVELPDDLLTAILARLRPRSLFRAMLACHRLQDLGRACATWEALRAQGAHPAPKPSARVYKTAFDVVTRRCCRLCWLGARDAYGFCSHCRAGPSSVAAHYHSLSRSRALVTHLNRKLAKVREQLHMAEVMKREEDSRLRSSLRRGPTSWLTL